MARLRHGQGRRLPGRPAGGGDHVPRGGRRRHRARALRAAVQPHTGRPHRPAPVRRPHPQPRRSARTPGLLRRRPHRPHDPADALPAVRGARCGLLQRVPRARRGLRGRRSPPGRGRRRRLPAGHRRPPSVRVPGRPVRHRRVRPHVQGLVECPHAHGRRARAALPAGRAAAGHGVLPVPPDGHPQARHPAVGGGPGRGRHPAQRRGRALHGALRPDGQGPGAARHGQPGHAHRDPPGSRRRSGQGLPPPRPHPPPTGADRRQAARHRRVRPHLPRHRAKDGAHPRAADRPLRHGRHPHQRLGRGRPRRRRHRRPGPVRGRRVRVRLGPRCQPAGHELPARHRGVRPPGGAAMAEYVQGGAHFGAPGRSGRATAAASGGSCRPTGRRTWPTSAAPYRRR